MERRLAAILLTDIVEYSRLVRLDEEGTIALQKAHRDEVFNPKISEHRGRIVKMTGDGLMAEFPSVVDAVACAVEVQRTMAERDAGVGNDRRVRYRIGINLGDVVIDDGDILGDGVNIAARLESLAKPGGVCISGAVHDQLAGKLAVSFRDAGEQSVKNVSQPVRVLHWHSGQTELGLDEADTNSTPADEPSIAVLPFDNMSGDVEQDYFADGLAEEIINALSRMPWFHTIARNSSFVYRGRSVDIRQAGRELGAQYVLEGSIRRAGIRVRVSAQLIEAGSGSSLWADRFDGDIEDIFEVQDQISASIVAAVMPNVENAETLRARSLRSNNLTAYNNYLLALPHYRAHTPAGFAEALNYLSKARDRDPNFALAAALAAMCIFRPIGRGWTIWSDARVEEAVAHARHALIAGKNDALTMVYSATVLAFGAREYDTALAVVSNALSLAPNHAEVLERAGGIELWSGELDNAIEHLLRARRLNPKDPGMYNILNGLAAANFYSGRFEVAAEWARRTHVQKPDFAVGLRYLAASLAHTGQLDKAQHAIGQLLSLQPDCTVSSIERLVSRQLRNRSMLEPLLSGLKMAGMPD